MIKCKSCGEMNLDTNKFCISCGSSLADSASNAMKEALEQAQKGFERDALVSIDRSRVTYVCTVCGTVNSIDMDKCTKCGKPRPRNEFVSALKRIRQGQEYREGMEEEQEPEIIQDVEPEQMPQQPQQPIQEQPRFDGSMYAGGGGQANAVVQPFVIVPFVNPDQEIWQSKPNQLYRFQPYTEQEIADILREREEQARALREAQKLQEEYSGIGYDQPEEEMVFRKKVKPVRIVSVILMLITIATIVLAYLINMYKVPAPKGNESMLFFVSGIGECISGQFNVQLWDKLGYGYSAWTDFIAPTAFIVFLILTLAVLIRSFVRAVKGLAKTKGWFLPLLALLFFLTGVIGLITKYQSFTTEGLQAFIDNAQIGMYVLLGLAVLMVIVSIFCPANAKVERSNKKSRRK